MHYLFQIPFGTQNPDDNNPIDLSSPFDVIMYIVMPILMLIFYILWRRNKKKDGN
ncbi:adenylosuccinate synthetase [Cellulophaga sp. L1A9]|uniref:adenylosuccinate synthetase n=1 Tax=Cellulophaga sp. L1A9 TaxID=2686362 RepID=UPI001E497F1F|nr:adenylosuccinate synthetase [Cellulophaga sp. L1A9]